MPSAGSAVASFRANVTGTYNVRIQPLDALMYVRSDSAHLRTSCRDRQAHVKPLQLSNKPSAMHSRLTAHCQLTVP